MADKTIADLTATTSISTSDVFEVQVGVNSRRITASDLAKGLAPLGFRGALVKKAADQTGANYSGAGAVVAWDSEIYDTDGIHDNVTNNTRLTIPSGASYVRLAGQITLANHTTDQYAGIYIIKNGSAFDGYGHQMNEIGQAAARINASSAVIAVTPGDYFEMMLQVEVDASVDVTANRSWFSMEVVA